MGGWHVHGLFHLAPRQVCGTVRDKGSRTMGWQGKLALDGLVAVVVWAIGAVLFFQFMDKEDLEILFLCRDFLPLCFSCVAGILTGRATWWNSCGWSFPLCCGCC